jgi:hypothetical protein
MNSWKIKEELEELDVIVKTLQLEKEEVIELVEEVVEEEEDQDHKVQLKLRLHKHQFNRLQQLDLIYCLLS